MAEEKKTGKNFIASAIFSVILIAILEWRWPSIIPIDVWSVWDTHDTSVKDWFMIGLPVFCWGVGLNVLLSLFKSSQAQDREATFLRSNGITGGNFFVIGTVVSTWAGIMEEICFRWLIFLGAIPSIKLGNWLLFDCVGFGIAEWFHLNVWGSFADWTTFRFLSDHIFFEGDWAVGAAMLYANAFFRNGHKYQGLLGIVNSWFIGMFFFWVMFNYGLLAAIVIHFLYDFFIFTYGAIRVALIR